MSPLCKDDIYGCSATSPDGQAEASLGEEETKNAEMQQVEKWVKVTKL